MAAPLTRARERLSLKRPQKATHTPWRYWPAQSVPLPASGSSPPQPSQPAPIRWNLPQPTPAPRPDPPGPAPACPGPLPLDLGRVKPRTSALPTNISVSFFLSPGLVRLGPLQLALSGPRPFWVLLGGCFGIFLAPWPVETVPVVILPSCWYPPGLGRFRPAGAHFWLLSGSLCPAIPEPSGGYFGQCPAPSGFSAVLGPPGRCFGLFLATQKMLAARCARTEAFNANPVETQVRSCQIFVHYDSVSYLKVVHTCGNHFECVRDAARSQKLHAEWHYES